MYYRMIGRLGKQGMKHECDGVIGKGRRGGDGEQEKLITSPFYPHPLHHQHHPPMSLLS